METEPAAALFTATSHMVVPPEIGAFDLLLAIARHKDAILCAGTAAGLLALIISLMIPGVYTATVRILPPQQTQSMAAAMLGQLGPLANLAGHDLGLKNPNDIYAAMLESRSVADALIRRFDLSRHYRSRSVGAAREELAKRTAVLNGKDGIISVSCEDEDSRRAADLSNAYVDELTRLSRTLAMNEAAQRRLFYESQLQLAKQQLSDAETALQATQESTGLIEPGEQAKAIIDSVAALRAQIAAKEVRLKAMSAFATKENPEYVRTQGEIAGLRSELSQLETGSGTRRKGDVQVATEKVPEAGMEYVRGYREVKYHEMLLELIAKQYEIARMDEGRDVAVIQVLDPAIPPEKKSRPDRASIVLGSSAIVLLIAMLVAIVAELPLLNSQQKAKCQLIKAQLIRKP